MLHYNLAKLLVIALFLTVAHAANDGVTIDAIHRGSMSDHSGQRVMRYRWYALSDDQYTALVKALARYHPAKPLLILTATADSLELAEDFDMAFSAIGLTSKVDRPMDVVDGLHVTDRELADIITNSTRIPVVVDDADPDNVVMNFGRKVHQ